MEFKKQKPIYMQIAERLCNDILEGKYKADERFPSVRDVATQLGVNPNTVMRSFDYLQGSNIIYNRRGVGYFVASNAMEGIFNIQRKNFLEEDVPEFVFKMRVLGVSLKDLEEIINHQNTTQQ